jgi:hypothetical protein
MRDIKVAADFSRHPAGRFFNDGKFSGEAFRQKFLEPALRANTPIRIDLDDVRGYGSSFLEEAFGGLVRKGYRASRIRELITIRSARQSLMQEIWEYVDDADALVTNPSQE